MKVEMKDSHGFLFRKTGATSRTQWEKTEGEENEVQADGVVKGYGVAKADRNGIKSVPERE